jgi:Ca2+-binding EF-hand superfamily protein
MKSFVVFVSAAALTLLSCGSARAADPPAIALPGMDFLVKVMLDYLDTNGDGILDKGEFTSGTAKSFSELDKDSDGFISVQEMDDLAGPLAEAEGGSDLLGRATAFLVRSMLLTMDANKDNQISKAEFTKGCDAMFDKLDVNHDGQLSKEELMAMPARLLAK